MNRMIATAFLLACLIFSANSQECLVDEQTKETTHFEFYTAYERTVTNPYMFTDSYFGDGSGPVTVRMRMSIVTLGPQVDDCEICMNNYGFIVHFEMKRSDMAYFKIRPDALEFITADKESHVVDGNLSGAMADTDHWFWRMPDNTSSIEFVFPVESDEGYEMFKAIATQSVREVKIIDRALGREIQVGPKNKLSISYALLCLAKGLETEGEGDSTLYGLKDQLDDIQFGITTGMSMIYPSASLTGDGVQIPPETEIQILEWESENVAKVAFEDQVGFMSALNIQ